jgi:hypothetical protein
VHEEGREEVTASKVAEFKATLPRVSPELLPGTAAQVARNLKLYSGDLIPTPAPVAFAAAGRSGPIRTLYALRDPGTADLRWLTWSGEVDIATPAADELNEQRFYFTGDGKPKVSTYALAAAGPGPYPAPGGAYDLGLPLPEVTPLATPIAFEPVECASFARDSGGNVTFVTSGPHSLKDGALATISGFSYRTGKYTRTGTTVTVTILDHGLVTGTRIYIEFTSGAATTNSYTVTVATEDTFTVTDTVSGATTGDCRWDIRDLNITTTVTVINPTTISYFSPGAQIGLTPVFKVGTYSQSGTTVTITLAGHGYVNGDKVTATYTTGDAVDGEFTVAGATTDTFTLTAAAALTTSGGVEISALSRPKLDLGGLVQSRNYLYTWYTPWDEESIGSEPSAAIFIKEGQIVTVSALPSTPPAGSTYIRGIRLYRTLSATAQSAEADYFRLATLWFPQPVASVARTGGKVTLVFAEAHKFIEDDRLKLAGCSVAGFDIVDAEVTDVPDRFTVVYEQAGADVATTTATGTVYYDFAENPSEDAARYWGDGTFNFTDDFNFRSLTSILESNDYDPPPEDLQGLTVVQNNILAGFVGNDIYFTEPDKFHAWPGKYKISLEHDIVGLRALGSDLFVMTTGYPYIISGSDPAVLSTSRYATNYPCLSARSIVQTDVGVMYATHEGLAVASLSGGVQIITAVAHSPETWKAALDPATLVATFYDGMYFGAYSTGSFFFRRTEGGGAVGDIIDQSVTFTAAWFDAASGYLYYVAGESGDIFRWDDITQPTLTAVWRSKVFVTPKPFNMGAARVVADYAGVAISPLWGEYDATWAVADTNWFVTEPIRFRLFANKEQVFERQLVSSDVFRLPSGYKTDTYEVEVESVVRIRSLHLGETPTSLARS